MRMEKMVWNWDVDNTIVFSWWTTSSKVGLAGACVLVALLSFLWEGLAYWQRARDQEALATESHYANLGLTEEPLRYRVAGRWSRALLYGVRTFGAIVLMLTMMTFNGWLIGSIVLGSILAHYSLGSMTGCH